MTISTLRRIPVAYFYFAAPPVLARLVSRPVILCFHRVKKADGSLFDDRVTVTDPDLFKRLLKYVRSLGYRFVPLERIIESTSKPRPERVAAITFDDGFKDLFQNAYPILKKLAIPFTLFLTTSTVDSERLLWLHKLYVAIDKLTAINRPDILRKYFDLQDVDQDLRKIVGNIVQANNKTDNEILASNLANEAGLSEIMEREIAKNLYLTKVELLEMQEYGLSIDPHGHEHLSLPDLSRVDTKKEIETSVDYIRQEFHRKPTVFCLPFGRRNQFVQEIVAGLGLKGIATTERGLMKKSEDPFDLPRFCLTNNNAWFYRELTRRYWQAILERYVNRI
jgi:peptidoglycan/xylan/chitin deacetylase (PgdA/CDA1 family)